MLINNVLQTRRRIESGGNTMTNDLDRTKKEAEIEKIKIETTVLKNPFKKPSNWIASLVAAAGIFTAILQWQVSDVQKEKVALEAERRIFEAKKELEKVKELKEQHKKELDKLQGKYEGIQRANQELIAQTENQQQALVRIEKNIAEKSKRLAGLTKQLKSQGDIETAKEFIQESKNLESQIAAQITELRKDVRRYWVVVGSYDAKEDAEKFTKEINRTDPTLDAFVGLSNVRGFYPVIVGGAASLTKAKELKRKALQLEIIKDAFISPID